MMTSTYFAYYWAFS